MLTAFTSMQKRASARQRLATYQAYEKHRRFVAAVRANAVREARIRHLARAIPIVGETYSNEGADPANFDIASQSLAGLRSRAYNARACAITDVTWIGPFNDFLQAPRVAANLVMPTRAVALSDNASD